MPSPRIKVLVDGSPLDATVLAQLTRAEVRESDCDPSVLALRFRSCSGPTASSARSTTTCSNPASC